MKRQLKKLISRSDGAVTVETSFIISLLILLTGGSIEAGYAFFQYNGAQQAARTGARIAATSNPVSGDILTMTNLASSNYERHCSDKTNSCSQGSYDSVAMNKIIFGPDDDGKCGATTRARRGMCDVFSDVEQATVDVSYISSGLSTASTQTNPAPLVSVTLRDVPVNFLFLDLVGFKNIISLPPVEVTLMGEDLRNG